MVHWELGAIDPCAHTPSNLGWLGMRELLEFCECAYYRAGHMRVGNLKRMVHGVEQMARERSGGIKPTEYLRALQRERGRVGGRGRDM